MDPRDHLLPAGAGPVREVYVNGVRQRPGADSVEPGGDVVDVVHEVWAQ